MTSVGGGSVANVTLHLNVTGENDLTQALARNQAKLDALTNKYSTTYGRLSRALEREEKALKKAEGAIHKHSKALYMGARSYDALKAAGGGLLKILKYQTIEFGLLVIALGAMKLALVAGRITMKAFHASLIGLGAAAGVAVAAISAVLGAMQQLQIAQMKPMFAGVYGSLGNQFSPQGMSRSATGLTRNMAGDRRFGMFSDQALQQVMAARLQRGQQVGGSFRNELARLGDYTGGDEKALVALNEAMAEAQKQGKVTQDVYSQLIKSSPVMQAAFEELAGGVKQAEAAAVNGSISYDRFHAALIDGNLKALAPYKGNLDAINNTIIGKFKGSIRVLKNELSGISMTSANEAYGSGSKNSILDAVGGSINRMTTTLSATIAGITPMLRQVTPQLFTGVGGMMSSATERFTFYIGQGMHWLDTFGNRMDVWIGNVRNFFSKLGGYLVEMTTPFDTLWNTFLKPFMGLLGGVLSDWFRSFGQAVEQNTGQLEAWAATFGKVREFFAGLFEVGNVLKRVMGPIVEIIFQLGGVFGSLFSGAITGKMMIFLTGVALLSAAFRKGYVAANEWRGSMEAARRGLSRAQLEYQTTYHMLELIRAEMEKIVALNQQWAASSKGKGGGKGGGAGPGSTGPIVNPTVPPGSPGDPRPPAPPPANLRGGARAWWDSVRDRAAYRRALAQDMKGDGFLSRLRQPKVDRLAAKAEGWYGMSPEDKEAARQQRADKWRMRSTMGLMMAGGMVQQYGGDNAVAQGLGGAMTGAGMGGMTAQMMGASTGIGVVVGGGLAAGGAIKRATPNTSNFGQATGTALQYMGGGALAGAAIGSAVPLIGTAVGAAVGGTIGGVVGAIKGWRDADANRQKEEDARNDELRDIGRANGPMNSVANARLRMRDLNRRFGDQAKADLPEYREYLKAVATRERTSLQLDNPNLSQTERAAIEKERNAAKARIRSSPLYMDPKRAGRVDAYMDALNVVQKRANNLASEFSSGNFFGFKPKELAKYANRHNMDLSKTNLSIKALVKLSGYSMEAVDAMANFAVAGKRFIEDVTGMFDVQTRRAQAGIDRRRIVAEYGRTAQADRASGITRTPEERLVSTNEALKAIVTDQGEMYASGAFGKGPEAYQKFQSMIRQQIYSLVNRGRERFSPEMYSTLLYQANSLLGGGPDGPGINNTMASQMRYNPELVAELGRQGELFTEENRGLKGKALTDKLNSESLRIAEELKTRFGLTSSKEEIALNLRKKLAGSLEADGTSVSNKIRQALIDGANLFTSYHLVLNADNASFSWTKSGPAPGSSARTARGTQSPGALGLTNAGLSGWMANNPRVQWLTAAGYEPTPGDPTTYSLMDQNGQIVDQKSLFGDTRTSRFGRTLAAHAALSRMVPGNQRMTSGLRNFALGSPSSDHFTGRAYDLTGDNLGAYARNVTALGGFAEFHGAGGSRHLHVVPPIGDTSSPVAMGGGVHNYSIVVNAPDGASPAAIADEVMARIARKQRDAMERA